MTLFLNFVFRLSPKYVLGTSNRAGRASGGVIPCSQSEESKGWLVAFVALSVERGLPSQGQTASDASGLLPVHGGPSCCSGLRFWGRERAGKDEVG